MVVVVILSRGRFAVGRTVRAFEHDGHETVQNLGLR